MPKKMRQMKFIPCEDLTSKRRFWDFVERVVDFAKPGKRINYFSTMDLNGNLRLFPDYLKRRAARRKARADEENCPYGQYGGDVY